MTDRPIYIDIDGTLTNNPTTTWGKVLQERIKKIKCLVAENTQVVVWSGNGTQYAKAFCEKHGIEGVVALGKPEYIVDDNPDIRPKERMPVLTPFEFFGA